MFNQIVFLEDDFSIAKELYRQFTAFEQVYLII